MILTVTPNSALDRIFFIESWTPGLPIRIDRQVTAVGGKGLDASVSLSCQGIASTAITFVAGDTGRELVDLINGYGIQTIPIWVAGETRVAHVVAERVAQQHTHLIAGQMVISAADRQRFFAELKRQLGRAAWLISGGSLPKDLDSGFFTQAVELAHAAGIPSLVDTSALPLEPVLRARPAILKINQVEFANAFGVAIATPDAILHEGQRVRAAFQLNNLVITCGPEGLYALTNEGAYHAQAPSQLVVNAAGAGDAISGTLPYHLTRESGWAEALRQATAVAAATVLTEATAESRPADIARILPAVRVTRLD